MLQKSPLKTCPCCGAEIVFAPDLIVSLDYNTASRNGVMVGMEPQSAVLAHELARRWPATVRYDRLETVMHGHMDHPGDFHSVLKVRVCRLRHALKPLGVGIANSYGVGYRLELL
jgi:DNA-binding response OmpR family regulator